MINKNKAKTMVKHITFDCEYNLQSKNGIMINVFIFVRTASI